MRKFLSAIIAIIMIFSLSATAFAAETEEVIQTTYTNEYDYIVAIQEMSDEELNEIGMTPADVDATVSAFYAALAERAALPVETLVGYGYTNEEIAILKSQNATTYSLSSSALSDEQMRALTGTCTGTITSSYLSTRYATFIANQRINAPKQ